MIDNAFSRRTLLRSIAGLATAGLAPARATSRQSSSARFPGSPGTVKPERPWNFQYHQTLVIKLFLAQKLPPSGSRTYLTFEQTLDAIRRIDNLTRTIPKIVYLVGWQFDGHDSKYPSWSEVNHRLKRPQDSTAVDSLKWLMSEGSTHQTTVSLHINMKDAYPDSPLWDTYVSNDLLCKEKDGTLKRGGIWDGQQAYLVCYTREWNEGFAQKRIDGLLNLLPIQKAGTIHIDAFESAEDPGHGIAKEEQAKTQRQIFRYWQDKGVDVTSEMVYHPDPFVGIQPMAWNFGFTLRQYMDIPASLFCGGVDSGEGGKLFGTSMTAEGRVREDAERMTGLLQDFCLQTVPWYYLNRHDRLRLLLTTNMSEATFSDGLVVRLYRDHRYVIEHNGRLLREGDNVFMPALWLKNKELIAFSADGYEQRTWQLPPDWKEVKRVTISEITMAGNQKLAELAVDGRTLTMSLRAGQAVSIIPARS
jgi:hypothetical protein